MMGKKEVFASLGLLILVGCSEQASDLNEYEVNLQDAYATKPEFTDSAAALYKDGPAGRAWLATIHGYPNNLEVCEELVEPYNSDPSLSDLPGTYRCRYVENVHQP